MEEVEQHFSIEVYSLLPRLFSNRDSTTFLSINVNNKVNHIYRQEREVGS
jgi:hypothetical protein